MNMLKNVLLINALSSGATGLLLVLFPGLVAGLVWGNPHMAFHSGRPFPDRFCGTGICAKPQTGHAKRLD